MALQDAAYHDKRGADASTAVRWWIRWTRARRVSPVQVTTVWSRPEERRAVEGLLEQFAVWLHDVRSISVQTVRAYVSTVTAWHHRRFGPMLPHYEPVRLRALLRGMRLQSAPPAAEERVVTTQEVARGTSELCDMRDADSVTLCAAAQAGFCGLLRSAEYCVRGGARFDGARLPIVADLRFAADPVEAAVFPVWPCKKGVKVKGKVFDVVLRDGQLLKPMTLMRKMMELRRLRGRVAANAPLFEVAGRPLTAERLSGFVQAMVRAAGGGGWRRPNWCWHAWAAAWWGDGGVGCRG